MKEPIPQWLAVDSAQLLLQFAEMHNTNDPVLEDNDIDWWFLHKTARRLKHYLKEEYENKTRR